MQQLADFFQVSKSTVQYHLSRPFDPIDGCSAGQTGRPSIFTQDQIRELEAFVQERFTRRLPVSYEDLREFVHDMWGIMPNLSSLRRIINESDTLKTVIGQPMEDSRIFVSREAIDKYFDEAHEIIDSGRIPAAFVLNLDESGFDQFADSRQSIRIVQATYALNSIPVGVTRAEKRASLIAAICADGTALKPMVVVQRDTVEKELMLRGYTPDNVLLGRSETGFVNTRLFIEWAKRCLFPQMRQRRAELDYDGTILQIYDGFGCHQSEQFLQLAEAENFVCLRIPPHSSDQVQRLDLALFGNQKRWQSNITVEPGLNRQTKQVIKICDSFRMATTHKNVVSAFRRGGIVTWWDDTTLTLMVRVDRSYATALRGEDEDEPVILPGDKERVPI